VPIAEMEGAAVGAIIGALAEKEMGGGGKLEAYSKCYCKAA
jgi:hypothetical protein